MFDLNVISFSYGDNMVVSLIEISLLIVTRWCWQRRLGYATLRLLWLLITTVGDTVIQQSM